MWLFAVLVPSHGEQLVAGGRAGISAQKAGSVFAGLWCLYMRFPEQKCSGAVSLPHIERAFAARCNRQMFWRDAAACNVLARCRCLHRVGAISLPHIGRALAALQLATVA